MEKVLYLPLMEKWFNLIKSGIKTEEYREITPYWKKRLMWKDNRGVWQYKTFSEIEFTLGYPKSSDISRRIRKKLMSIQIGKGKKEWGANPNKVYFVLKIE